eukprot:scaffold23542_cov147-Cylindrotheca_fusiformis.AAC.2
MKGTKKDQEAEERFTSLLQRIQKQYIPPEQQQHALSFLMERPPDEAAFAMGNQLALLFQEVLVSSSSSEEKSTIQDQTLLCLQSPTMNPSVLQSFLSTMLLSSSDMGWLSSWILHADKTLAEEGNKKDGSNKNWDALTAMMNCYARFVQRSLSSSSGGLLVGAAMDTTTASIATLFRKLQSSSSQISMMREFTIAAFISNDDNNNDDMSQVRPMLSPLMAAVVLSVNQNNQQQQQQHSILFLEGIWREAWAAMSKIVDSGQPQEHAVDVLFWLTESLDLYLMGIQSCCCRWPDDHQIACKEIAHRWLIQILEMASYLVQECADSTQQQQKLSKWLSNVVVAGTLIRLFSVVPTFRISLKPLLIQIQFIIQHLRSSSSSLSSSSKATSRFALDATQTHRLAVMLLCNPIREDVRELLQILTASIVVTTTTTTTMLDDDNAAMVHSMLRGVGSMLGRSEFCATSCDQLIQAVMAAAAAVEQQQQQHHGPKHGGTRRSKNNKKSMQSVLELLLLEDSDTKEIVQFLASESATFSSQQLSVGQQMGALLLGIGLLDTNGIDANKTKNPVQEYFNNLLSHYPHLGVSLLPIIVESINTASFHGDGKKLLRQLNFLCGPIVMDAQCAREIWNLLGVELLQPHIPATIRAAVIRLFPRICAANKRLYKRIIVALGNSLVAANSAAGIETIDNGDLEVRLAIAATIADLAREDRIRDVTDVIGWIQGFIEDSGWVRSVSTVDAERSAAKSAIVHYALLSLHYLVMSQELDYTVVMAVLRKRLCDIHDMLEVVKLPPLVLETLALLLGDGECDDDSSNDDEVVGVHPQVRQSVQTLINLSLAKSTHPNAAKNDAAGYHALLRCRQNIYTSLSRYSIEALGLDEEGIQAVCQAANNPDAPAVPASGARYMAIKRVIEEGLVGLHDFNDNRLSDRHLNVAEEDGTHLSKSLVALTRKVLKLEEETIGSTLWQKRGKAKQSHKSKSSDSSVDSTYSQSLPSGGTIMKIYQKNHSTATALSMLLCNEDKPLSTVTSAVDDITNEHSDPILYSFTVQAWLNVARNQLVQLVKAQSSSQGLEQMLTEIRDWRFQLEEPDNMYIALSALALYIPEILGPFGDHSAYVEEICEEVLIAYKEHAFGNADVAKLCAAFACVCFVRTDTMSRVEEIVGSLERSVTAYGGGASFGACFGLAVIAQSLSAPPDTDHSVGAGFIQRIVGFLLNQLLPCIKGNHQVLQSLVVCVENGTVEPAVIDALTELRKQNVQLVDSKRPIAKTILVAFALCLPALTSVNDELLLGFYCLLDCIPWGSGKGFTLPPVLDTCHRYGLFETAEIEKIYSKYTETFEDGMEKGVEGLDDIFFAVTSTTKAVVPHSIRRFLVGNKKLFDEDGRCISLLSAVASLCSLPCLGHGGAVFTATPHLLPVASKNDISGVSSLIIEAVGVSGHDLSKYSQVAMLLMGFMASLKSSVESTDSILAESGTSFKSTADSRTSKLPTPHQGTALEILMAKLAMSSNESKLTESMGQDTRVILNCLETLSLPGHFTELLEHLLDGDFKLESTCTALLLSQIQGRPRAVFDGREFVDLAFRISKTPVATSRKVFGQGESPSFIESFDAVISKLPSEKVDDAMQHVWGLCLHELQYSSGWALSFLSAIQSFIGSQKDKKKKTTSPKTLKGVVAFLLRTVFSGIRDASWTETSASTEPSLVDQYARCLQEIPISSLVEVKFFAPQDDDGFLGEALRYRCIMILVSLGYFATPARASSEIQAALSWFSRQVVSSGDQVFSTALLHVTCSFADATTVENAEKRKGLLLMLLDDLLLVGSKASIVGLQMLGALVCQWCKGRGSDGNLSMLYVCSTSMTRWQDLSSSTLRKMFEVLVHDLPYNLASFAKAERIENIVFNRLFRIYNTWFEQGVDKETIGCVRDALVCCRNEESGADEFDYVASTILL